MNRNVSALKEAANVALRVEISNTFLSRPSHLLSISMQTMEVKVRIYNRRQWKLEMYMFVSPQTITGREKNL